MPLKINGYSIPIKEIIIIGSAAFWLAALSFQVNANGDGIKKQEDTNERLVRMEERQVHVKEDQKAIKEDIKDIKEAQKEAVKVSAAILAAINKE